MIDDYFEEHCQSTGTAGIILLRPIIDWSNAEVWDYIHLNHLPINPEYKECNRVGCVVCPKANFISNYKYLLKYPKLIDVFIKAKGKGSLGTDWIITCEKRDYSNDKCYYICRWLNHSFMPFTKKQEELYQKVKTKYDLIHENRTIGY